MPKEVNKIARPLKLNEHFSGCYIYVSLISTVWAMLALLRFLSVLYLFEIPHSTININQI